MRAFVPLGHLAAIGNQHAQGVQNHLTGFFDGLAFRDSAWYLRNEGGISPLFRRFEHDGELTVHLSHIIRPSRRPKIRRNVDAQVYNPLMDVRGIITIEPGKRGGRPCVRGMRIAVADVLGWLAAGMSHAEVMADFPELTEQDIRACLAFAAERETRTVTPA